MNIFVLDFDPQKCAEYHCDRHVIKMILEYAQMLCTTHSVFGLEAPYRMTHQNHPCTIWVRESIANYNWLCELARHLNDEYKFRYQKTENHKSYDVITSLPNPNFLPNIGQTPYTICMPEEIKIGDDVMASYRNFYMISKREFLTYKIREKPYWLEI
jgi:hypothetical protein